jgi:hypothetical protein
LSVLRNSRSASRWWPARELSSADAIVPALEEQGSRAFASPAIPRFQAAQEAAEATISRFGWLGYLICSRLERVAGAASSFTGTRQVGARASRDLDAGYVRRTRQGGLADSLPLRLDALPVVLAGYQRETDRALDGGERAGGRSSVTRSHRPLGGLDLESTVVIQGADPVGLLVCAFYGMLGPRQLIGSAT